MACLELNELSAAQLSNRLAITKTDASVLFDRLQYEGYTKCGTSSKTRKSGCVNRYNSCSVSIYFQHVSAVGLVLVEESGTNMHISPRKN